MLIKVKIKYRVFFYVERRKKGDTTDLDRKYIIIKFINKLN